MSGIYQAQLTTSEGQVETERWAYNVVPEEGNLQRLDQPQLVERLGNLKFEYREAHDQDYQSQQLAGVNLGDDLMMLLIAVLLCEQVLAYLLSYHPKAAGGSR